MYAKVRLSFKNLAMTLGSCRVKTEDGAGAGLQNVLVNLFVIAQYAIKHKMACIPLQQSSRRALLELSLGKAQCVHMQLQ